MYALQTLSQAAKFRQRGVRERPWSRSQGLTPEGKILSFGHAINAAILPQFLHFGSSL